MRFVFWAVVFAIIIWRYNYLKPHFVDGQKIRVTEKVSQEPNVYSDAQGINLFGLKTYLPLYPKIDYQDVIVVEGTVDLSKNTLRNPELKSITKNNGYLVVVRKKLLTFYKKAFPSKDASLIAGVVIGSKEGIGQTFWEKLKNTGTAHVVVASGMNVTLVAGFLMTLFVTVLPRKKAIIGAILGIWIYSFLCGFEPPIVRAAIMASLAFGAQALGRLSFAWRSLFISASGMLIINPLWITDIGFILSFTATVCLMLFEVRVNRLIYFVPSIFREGLSTSIAAQIGVAPIIYFYFGQFNILSPLINALILWTIPVITVIGGIAGVIGLFWFDLGKLILYLSYPLTSWFIYVVNTL